MKLSEILLSVFIAICCVAVVLVYTSHYSYNEVKNEIIENEEVIPEIIIKYEYGIAVDSFEVIRDRVRRNQPLSSILHRYNIGNREIHDLSVKSEGIFDLRKIRSGNNYAAFLAGDSIKELHYLVYEHTPLDYVVFGLKDTISIRIDKKAIDTMKRYFTGSIRTSLWNTMKDNDTNPMLAIELSEIYAWSIDFFGLQRGDSIRVIYDELFVDSIPVGIGKIHGAYFRHVETDFWAIPFVQDSIEDYYDDKGQSLRKAFLKAPLRYSRISSGFSNSRLHPILRIRRPHHGVDYAAPSGTPVLAIGDGVVVFKGYNGGAGNMIKIKHNSVYQTAYLHLSRYGKGIQKGTYVKQGDVIGYVGSTGLSTGPHLDYRFYKNNSPVNPLKVEAPPVDPVKEKNLSRYEFVRDLVMMELSSFY